MNIIIVNGPNLNLLGEREPDIYGSETLNEINSWIENHEICTNLNLEFFQSNSEGSIIDFIHSKRKDTDYLIINPGAFTHYSYALRDAIKDTIRTHMGLKCFLRIIAFLSILTAVLFWEQAARLELLLRR